MMERPGHAVAVTVPQSCIQPSRDDTESKDEMLPTDVSRSRFPLSPLDTGPALDYVLPGSFLGLSMVAGTLGSRDGVVPDVGSEVR